MAKGRVGKQKGKGQWVKDKGKCNGKEKNRYDLKQIAG